MDVAQEPSKLEREGSPKVGGDSRGTVCDGHGLRDKAGVSSHLQTKKCPGDQTTYSETGALGCTRCGGKPDNF